MSDGGSRQVPAEASLVRSVGPPPTAVTTPAPAATPVSGRLAGVERRGVQVAPRSTLWTITSSLPTAKASTPSKYRARRCGAPETIVEVHEAPVLAL